MSWTKEFTKHDYAEHEHLTFGYGNAKLDDTIATFSLPAGYTCPGAKECMAMAVRKDGKMKLQNGPHSVYTCFAASQELVGVSVRNMRWHNYGKLLAAERRGGVKAMAELIAVSLDKKALGVRIHVSGDFYSESYFKAWCIAAKYHSPMPMYAYTKSIPHWIKHKDLIPDNMTLVASHGGRFDELIEEHDLRSAKVVFHPDEAKALGLEIDHTDALAADPEVKKFVLLLHGMQRKDTDAAKALARMKQEGIQFSYNKETKHIRHHEQRVREFRSAVTAHN